LFSGTQQLFYVFNLLMTAQLVLLLLKLFAGDAFIGWQYFIPSISGVLLWKIALILGLNTGARDS
jgi:rod shape-determining protein MreD